MNNRTLFMVVGLVLALSQKSAMAADAPCAVVEKSGKGTQVIPKEGAVVTKFDVNSAVNCGSMVITHADGFSIRYSNQVMVRIAPNSFFEVGKEVSDVHRLYRGDLMVTGPAGSGDMVFTTPNGEVHFEGGAFTVKYEAQSRTTSVASFNRNVEFKNKFNTEASQTVKVGEVSRLTIHDIRVVPTQPIAMSPSSVKEGVAMFSLAKADEDEMVAVVSRVFEGRAKSLVSDLEGFRDSDQQKNSDDRAPASLKRYQEAAVDEKEEEFTMKMLRRRLYGDEMNREKINEVRAPASVKKKQAPEAVDDFKKEEIDQKKQKETGRVLKEISTLDTEE